MSDPDLSIGSYRRSVGTIIPEMTRVALLTQHAELVKEKSDFDRKKSVYRLSRAQYEQEWGTQYQQPGWRTRIFAAFVRILPKVGPLKNVDIKLPTPSTEDLYIKSVNQAVDSSRAQLAALRQPQSHIDLPNLDCETAKPTTPQEYKLADQTYASLVGKLADCKFGLVTPDYRPTSWRSMAIRATPCQTTCPRTNGVRLNPLSAI